jgi:hypothetical protein
VYRGSEYETKEQEGESTGQKSKVRKKVDDIITKQHH